MSNRATIHAEFTRRFAADGLDGPALPCPSDVLDRIEQELDTFLPVAFRDFLARCGPIFTPQLCTAWIEHQPESFPPREFLRPEAMVDDTRLYWSGGMPRDVIAFASDGCGNLLVFQRTARNELRPDDQAVLVFDHDYVKVVELAPSFDVWLGRFVAALP